MEDRIYRLQYRGSLKEEYSMEELEEALADSKKKIEQGIKACELMAGALFHYKQMLFFYYESVGERREPEELLSPLKPFLSPWPGAEGNRDWVLMNQIYYHSIPESYEEWKRKQKPEWKRGRIAFLKEDKWFSYVFYHTSLVEEGLLPGDKYHSIALHENILFSYFEEPKIMTNIKKDSENESEVIKAWTKAIPEDHFVKMPEGGGENFMFIPAYFALV